MQQSGYFTEDDTLAPLFHAPTNTIGCFFNMFCFLGRMSSGSLKSFSGAIATRLMALLRAP